jgi:hypothetical protein
MLRNIVFTLGVALIAIGLVLAVTASPGGALACLIFGSLIVLGILFERDVYKPVARRAPQGPGWKRTAERFVDEATGGTVTVYVNTETGERAYVTESAHGGEAGPAP